MTLRIEGGFYDYFGTQGNLDPDQKLLTYFAYRPIGHGLVLRLRPTVKHRSGIFTCRKIH